MYLVNTKRAFRDWLCLTNPSAFHNNTVKSYEPGTGEWFGRLPEWPDWLSHKIRSIWIHGIPGGGKTVLFSKLVNLLQTHHGATNIEKVGYAFYYCYHGHNQNEAAPFLRWVLSQLCQQAASIPKDIYAIYDSGLAPTITQLLSAVEQVLEAFDAVYLCLDAIDESQARQELLDVLRDLITDPRFEKVQLLTTSREYGDIKRVMATFSRPISMNHPEVEQDIRQYVKTTLANTREVRYWSPKLIEEAKAKISEGAKGM